MDTILEIKNYLDIDWQYGSTCRTFLAICRGGIITGGIYLESTVYLSWHNWGICFMCVGFHVNLRVPYKCVDRRSVSIEKNDIIK